MDRSAVEAAFVAAGLARLNKDIDRVTRSSIRLVAAPVDESTLKIGASKLGGLPDLPASRDWPELHGVPQSFIAQIRLADACPYDRDEVLSHDGMLWFFYDASQQTFGEQPADRAGWSVFYQDNDLNTLRRLTAPAKLPPDSLFKACSISFASELTLSLQPQLEIADGDWSKDEQLKYEHVLSTLSDPADHAAVHNRLLGHPDTIQDDMREQCQLVSHGVVDSEDPRVAALRQDSQDWRLLLQVDSDEPAGMMWANNGMLYWWITRADLLARRFDATWLVLQSE